MACKVQRNDINDKGLKDTHPAKQIVCMGDLLTKEMTLASRTAYTPLQRPSKLNPAARDPGVRFQATKKPINLQLVQL